MADINKLQIEGRAANAPEKKSEKAPYKFSLAHGTGRKRRDGSPLPPEWFDVTCWDAKIVEGIAKGDRVTISGKLKDATFTDVNHQVKRRIEILAETIEVEGAEKPLPPLTPDAIGRESRKDGTAVARAILSPPNQFGF